MKNVAGRSKTLPTFRDALLRVVLIPSALFLAGILIGSTLVVWRTGSSFEAQNAQLARSLAQQIGSRFDQREAALTLLSTLPPQFLGTWMDNELTVQDFESVHLLDKNGATAESWPEPLRTPIEPALVQALWRRLPDGDGTAWSAVISAPRSERQTAALLRRTGTGYVLGVLDPVPLLRDVRNLAAEGGMTVALLDPAGKPLLGEPSPQFLQEAARHAEAQFVFNDNVNGQWSQVLGWRLGASGWTLSLSSSLAEIDAPVTVVFYVLIPLVVLVLTLGLVFIRALNRQLVGALESLKVETRRITQGDYSEVLTRTPYQDLNDILQDFESMRESVWMRQQDLKDSEYRFRRMFEDAAVGILHTTFDGSPLDLNQAMARMLGYASPAEALASVKNVGTDLYVRPEERAAILQMLTGTAQGRIQITTEFYTREKRVLIVTNHLGRVYDTHRGEFILEAFIEDVTEIKRAEKAVLDMNVELERKVVERTRHLEKALDDLNTAQDQLVRSEKMAALGQLIAGIAHEINTPLGAISASNDNISILLKKVLEALPWLLQVLSLEQRALFYKMYEAAYRGVEVIPSAQLRQKRKQGAALLEPFGLEDEEEMIEYLAELDLIGRLEEFLLLIQDPLGRDAVKMAYEMVSLEKSCLVIEQASDKAAKVIGALKTFSHEEHGRQFHRVNIRESLENVLTLFQSRLKHGVELRTNLGEAPEVWGYADRLAQVWTNLVSNALQAMDYKGVLEIEAYKLEDAERGDQLQVVVRDSGPGIPDLILDRIFEPFFTTKKAGEGSGLGLDICRKIIQEHRGSIVVHTKPGRTEFVVSLPLVGNEGQEQQSSA